MQSEHCGFHRTFLGLPVYLLVFADINTQVEQSEQGTVSVATTFCNKCNLNFVLFIVHPRFTCVPFYFNWFPDIFADIDTPIQ